MRSGGKDKKKGKGNAGKQAAPKGGKGAKSAAAVVPPVFDLSDPAVISCLDIRVGCMSKAKLHPESDTLYVEEVAIGGGETRTVCSGLRNYLPIEAIAGPCIVVTNLRARKMGSVKSEAMIMAAMSGDKVELLVPPVGAQVGAQVTFEDTSGFGGFATAKKLDGGDGMCVCQCLRESRWAWLQATS